MSPKSTHAPACNAGEQRACSRADTRIEKRRRPCLPRSPGGVPPCNGPLDRATASSAPRPPRDHEHSRMPDRGSPARLLGTDATFASTHALKLLSHPSPSAVAIPAPAPAPCASSTLVPLPSQPKAGTAPGPGPDRTHKLQSCFGVCGHLAAALLNAPKQQQSVCSSHSY